MYLDTSAIVKRFRREAGTEVMDQLLGTSAAHVEVVTSFLAVLEVTSAVLRLRRGGQLTLATSAEILARWC